MSTEDPEGPAQELYLERWVTGGLCLAYAQDRTWFVRYGIPGETVRVHVTRRARGVVFADAVEVITRSEYRVHPPCPHFGPGMCGGCDLQHVRIDEQRRIKRLFLEDSLRRTGGLDAEALSCLEDTRTIPGDASGLRWRTRLTGTRTASGIGLHRSRSREREEITDCPITNEGLISAVRQAILPGHAFRAAVGSAGDVGIAWGETTPTVTQTVTTGNGPHSWRLPVTSFWQVHAGAAQYLGELLEEYLGPVTGERWWDLFAGAGLFSAFLAGAGASAVQMVESDDDAVRSARRSFHDERRVTIHHESVETWCTRAHEQPDGVVVDPPRRGCGAETLAGIMHARPRRLVYVSCDPASLGRDAAILREGGFGLVRVVPIDAFPMTHHVEAMGLFHISDRIS